MEVSDIEKAILKLLESNGDNVAINQPTCLIWKADHGNCVGCESELGCSKFAKILILITTNILYESRDFADFIKKQEITSDLILTVMNCKTREEVLAIRQK